MSFFNHFSFLSPLGKKQSSLQKNTYTNEKKIALLLKQLQQHLVIVTANFPSNLDIYNTSIIKVDYQNKLFYLDEFVPNEGNQQLESLKKVILSTRLDSSMINAECTLKAIRHEHGLNQYIMHFPEAVELTQRRESYRVNIPLHKRIKVSMKTESGQVISGFLNNLSFNGIAIRLESRQNINLKRGDNIPYLTVYIDKTIVCEMTVKRIASSIGSTIVSGYFEEISQSDKRIVQKYITQLDRKKQRQLPD